MISYLPEIYPDELAYSWFCRYYVHTGYMSHKAALNDILSNRHDNPSKEFLGHINPHMMAAIQQMYPISDVILCHTMYPQYARFIPLEYKKKALYHIGFDFCDVHHLFAILPRCEGDWFLKYCPICADEDRRQYGEAYWHRVHQIRNMQICTKHNCRLVNSAVVAKSEQAFTFCPAETYITDQKPVIETDPLKIAYAQYVVDVFNAPMDFEKDIPIRAVLYHGMQNTQYIKSTGKTRYTKQLAEDLNAYYKRLNICDIASMLEEEELDSCKNKNFIIKECARVFFDTITPLYGCCGTNMFVDGIEHIEEGNIINSKFFYIGYVGLSVSNKFDFINYRRNNDKFLIEKLKNGNMYIRKSRQSETGN